MYGENCFTDLSCCFLSRRLFLFCIRPAIDGQKKTGCPKQERFFWQPRRVERRLRLTDASAPIARRALSNGLRPGEHTVRVELPGHQSWEKIVTIKSGETSFAEAVVLFSEEQPQRSVSRTFDRAALNPSSSRIVWLTTQHGWTEAWVTAVNGSDARLVHRATADDALFLRWEDDDHVTVSSQNNAPIRIDVRDGRRTVPSFLMTFKEEETATLVRDENGNELARLPKGDYQIVDVRSPYVLLEQPSPARIILIDTSDKKHRFALWNQRCFTSGLGHTRFCMRMRMLFSCTTQTRTDQQHSHA